MSKAYIFSFLLFLAPVVTLAAGLVPCGGPGEETCQTCHFLQLIHNIVDWLVVVLTAVTVLLIMYAGLRLVTSMGNVSAMTAARSLISNCLVGFAIVLAGWLMIDLVLKSLTKDQVYGVWNEIQCVAQPAPTAAP